jgi:peptidoglycan/xylan/chitin deacetylase (PgdA/CDA1 family)
LRSLAAQQEVNIGLAVIPGLLEPELVDFLGAHSAAFFPMCHGWKHINHGDDSDPGEFGARRPHADARGDAIRALETFCERFAGTPVVFVPPFGRISTAMIAALPGIGFSGLSGGQRPLERRAARLAARFAWVPGLNIARRGPLPRVDAHVDLINWHARSAEDVGIIADRVVGQLRLRRKGFLALRTPIGLLTHHRVHDERIWQLLDALVDFLRRHGAEFVDVAGMFRPGAAAVDGRSGAARHCAGKTPRGT